MQSLAELLARRPDLVLPIDQAQRRLATAEAAVQKAQADTKKAEDAYSEVMASAAPRTDIAKKLLRGAQEKERDCADELDNARVMHAAAVRVEEAKAEAARREKRAALEEKRCKLTEKAEKPIAELAAIARDVHELQLEIHDISNAEERKQWRTAYDSLGARLLGVLAQRLSFMPGFEVVKQYALGWEDVGAGRVKWADEPATREVEDAPLRAREIAFAHDRLAYWDRVANSDRSMATQRRGIVAINESTSEEDLARCGFAPEVLREIKVQQGVVLRAAGAEASRNARQSQPKAA